MGTNHQRLQVAIGKVHERLWLVKDPGHFFGRSRFLCQKCLPSQRFRRWGPGHSQVIRLPIRQGVLLELYVRVFDCLYGRVDLQSWGEGPSWEESGFPDVGTFGELTRSRWILQGRKETLYFGLDRRQCDCVDWVQAWCFLGQCGYKNGQEFWQGSDQCPYWWCHPYMLAGAESVGWGNYIRQCCQKTEIDENWWSCLLHSFRH